MLLIKNNGGGACANGHLGVTEFPVCCVMCPPSSVSGSVHIGRPLIKQNSLVNQCPHVVLTSPPLHSEPPKADEPERWTDRQFSTLELLIHTHNKNPVERVSRQCDILSPTTCPPYFTTYYIFLEM